MHTYATGLLRPGKLLVAAKLTYSSQNILMEAFLARVEHTCSQGGKELLTQSCMRSRAR
jgi:hypothetical protein